MFTFPLEETETVGSVKASGESGVDKHIYMSCIPARPFRATTGDSRRLSRTWCCCWIVTFIGTS